MPICIKFTEINNKKLKIYTLSKLKIFIDFFFKNKTKAIKNHIQNNLSKEFSIKPNHVEGYENLKWVLMDYINIVINIFSKEEREYYNIERLWADADIKIIKDEK